MKPKVSSGHEKQGRENLDYVSKEGEDGPVPKETGLVAPSQLLPVDLKI
jgi:hypothetical protein